MSFALRHPVLGGTGFFLPANDGAFVSWMAGADVKGVVAYGESDERSWKATRSKR